MSKEKKSKKESVEEVQAPQVAIAPSQKTYSGSIALSKLKSVIISRKGKSGNDVRGIFIPIDVNHLKEGNDGAVYMALSVITKTPQDNYGQNGFIAQKGNKKWSECSDQEKEELKSLPILGNIKDFADSKPQSSNNNPGGSSSEVGGEDDLPF